MAFAQAFAETANRTVTNEARFRKKGGGQRGKLPNLEARVVVYLELYEELSAANVSRITVRIKSAEHLPANSQSVAEAEKSVGNTRLPARPMRRRFSGQIEESS